VVTNSALGYLADIEVAVKIQLSNGAVLGDMVGDCDSELYVFVVMVRGFAFAVSWYYLVRRI
jgi:hypothetical protein